MWSSRVFVWSLPQLCPRVKASLARRYAACRISCLVLLTGNVLCPSSEALLVRHGMRLWYSPALCSPFSNEPCYTCNFTINGSGVPGVHSPWFNFPSYVTWSGVVCQSYLVANVIFVAYVSSCVSLACIFSVDSNIEQWSATYVALWHFNVGVWSVATPADDILYPSPVPTCRTLCFTAYGQTTRITSLSVLSSVNVVLCLECCSVGQLLHFVAH